MYKYFKVYTMYVLRMIFKYDIKLGLGLFLRVHETGRAHRTQETNKQNTSGCWRKGGGGTTLVYVKSTNSTRNGTQTAPACPEQAA